MATEPKRISPARYDDAIGAEALVHMLFHRRREASEPFDSSTLHEHTRPLYRYALKRVRDPMLAQDLVQDTFLAALAGAGRRFAGRSRVRTWLTGILKHKIMDAFRERARAPMSYDDALAAGAVDPAAHAAESEPAAALERRQALQACQGELERMPPRAARAFVLTVLGHDTEKVCAMLGISSANLWTSVHRVRRSLRRTLEAQGA
jgi:RNA polymerase sigma-70 factor (ECF subfamily)